MRLGVVIVTFNSAPVILDCLDSLELNSAAAPYVVVVDNASQDDTLTVIERWASGKETTRNTALRHRGPKTLLPIELKTLSDGPVNPLTTLNIVKSPYNAGYAAAVNIGLKLLREQPDVVAFWILNPDCVVAEHTAERMLEASQNADGLLSSRCLYYEHPTKIQSDGGFVSKLSGQCVLINHGKNIDEPAPDSQSIEFLSGANLVVTRPFLDRVGFMPEEYFLYYEEVDWAFRRGELPLVFVKDAIVYHHGGTSIGSATFSRGPSPLSFYFNHRNRIRFVRRFSPASLPSAFMWSVAKTMQLALRGNWRGAEALLRGALQLSAPRSVRRKFSDPIVHQAAFGKS